jgi:hypothetical protein
METKQLTCLPLQPLLVFSPAAGAETVHKRMDSTLFSSTLAVG